MPRNSGGSYSLPAGNPVVTGTTVSSTWANSTLSDIATELTNSLARDGSGSMEEALLLTNGTASAPSLAFASETTTGLYLEGAQDVRLQVNATNALKATSAGVTIPLGLTVTQDTPNGSAVIGTANGSGYGGDFNAANSSGAGVRGTGVGSGTGAIFTGGITGPGVTGTGGATSGVGVVGIGTGASAGVSGTGSTTGAGVSGTGGATAGFGVLGTGGAGGAGVWGTGGTGDSIGVVGAGSGAAAGVSGTGGTTADTPGVLGTGAGASGVGVRATGAGTGHGIHAVGGSSSGIGGLFYGGAGNGTGIQASGIGNGRGGIFANSATSTAPALEAVSLSAAPAIQAGNGHLKMAGTNPASSTGFTNTLTPTNIVKAWGYITTAGGSSTSGTVVDGFNISSTVNLTTAVMTITFATAMPNANYAVIVSPNYIGGPLPIAAHVGNKTASTFTIGVHKESGGAGQATVNLTTEIIGISFLVLGAQ